MFFIVESTARFSPSKCTPGISISKNGRRAEYHKDNKDNHTEKWAFCDSPTDVFKVKVSSNRKHSNMFIGFVLSTSELREFWKKSWLIETGGHCLLEQEEWREWRGGRGIPITEGSTVSVEKLFEEKALVFRVNGKVIHEKVLTRLQASDFKQLIGCVFLFFKGDVVKIIWD